MSCQCQCVYVYVEKATTYHAQFVCMYVCIWEPEGGRKKEGAARAARCRMSLTAGFETAAYLAQGWMNWAGDAAGQLIDREGRPG